MKMVMPGLMVPRGFRRRGAAHHKPGIGAAALADLKRRAEERMRDADGTTSAQQLGEGEWLENQLKTGKSETEHSPSQRLQRQSRRRQMGAR